MHKPYHWNDFLYNFSSTSKIVTEAKDKINVARMNWRKKLYSKRESSLTHSGCGEWTKFSLITVAGPGGNDSAAGKP